MSGRAASTDFDVVVIGGGPAGATAATLIAKDGHRVLLLEKEAFPRHQIGESLLPSTLDICRLLGVEEAIEQAGFVRKYGATWHWGSQSKIGWEFSFDELPNVGGRTRTYSYQVQRARFDQLLLRNAACSGVEVREKHEATELLESEGNIAGLHIKDATGHPYKVAAKYVVDASGHASRFHGMVGNRIYAEQFRNLAIFGYFNGGKRLAGRRSGNILNVTFNKGWFWYIPIADDVTSVGAVISARDAGLLRQGYAAAMNSFIESCPMIKEYLAAASPITEGLYGGYRVRKDWSYCNTSFWRSGLALIGDAACFVDPLFSSGIHLATYAGLLLARSINTILRGEIQQDEVMKEFDTRYRLEYVYFRRFLERFYDTNLDKEDYFRHAKEIIGGSETEREAFVRLVSGLSQELLERPDVTASFADIRSTKIGLGAEGALDWSNLMPTKDKLRWQRRHVGHFMLKWRHRRNLSQREVASDAHVPIGQLRRIEAGLHTPSQELFTQIADVLRLPLRERRIALVAGGYATNQDTFENQEERRGRASTIVRDLLATLEPYPALVVDQYWNLVEVNRGAQILSNALQPGMSNLGVNIIRHSLNPELLAGQIVNLPEWRAYLLARLHTRLEATCDSKIAGAHRRNRKALESDERLTRW